MTSLQNGSFFAIAQKSYLYRHSKMKTSFQLLTPNVCLKQGNQARRADAVKTAKKHLKKYANILNSVLFACLLAVVAAPSEARLKKTSIIEEKNIVPSESKLDQTTKKKTKSRKRKTNPIAIDTPLEAVDDAHLAQVYGALAEGKLDNALALTDALLLKAPNFRLLHLIKADVLSAKAFRPPAAIAPQAQNALFGTGATARRMTELRAEAALRLTAFQNPPKPDELPTSLIAIPATVPRVILVDALRSRLFVYENSVQGLYLSRSYYMTQGKLGVNKSVEGDQKTPLGIYFSENAIDKKLPDLYGYGALNTDYPNAWDRRLSRTGHGIWLHGTPKETYARAPYASDGCVVLSNPDVAALFPLVNQKVPIVLAEQVHFSPAQAVQGVRRDIQNRIEAWVGQLGQADTPTMAAMYSKDFTPDVSVLDETRDGRSVLSAWLARKTAFSARQGGVSPQLVGFTAIAYPGEADLIETRFELHYAEKASKQTAKTVLRKTMYWRKIEGQWQIALETAGTLS